MRLGPKYALKQDPDVLDTWFSSALWPHSTLGWPEQTPELAYYYPTSALVTSRDIITLWVARMVLTGLYNMRRGAVPPRLHPSEDPRRLRRDDVEDRRATASIRWTSSNATAPTRCASSWCIMATENAGQPDAGGQRVPALRRAGAGEARAHVHADEEGDLPEVQEAVPARRSLADADDPELPTAKQASERFEMGRNFANKIWNAARFLLLNLDGYTPGAMRLEELPIEDRWILSRLATTTAAVTAQLEGYHFSEAARTIYDSPGRSSATGTSR